MTIRPIKFRLKLTIGVGIAAVAGILIVTGAGAGTVRPQRAHVSRRLVAHYGFLRRARSAAAEPALVAQGFSRLDQLLSGQLALDPSASQSVAFGGASSLWAQPGASGICVELNATLEVLGTSQVISPEHCEDTAGALTYGVVGGGRAGGTYPAWGIVPDGNAVVTAAFASGPSQSIPVHNNAFLATFSSQVMSLTFDDAAGNSVTVPTGPN
jgi:hypothetical protein